LNVNKVRFNLMIVLAGDEMIRVCGQ